MRESLMSARILPRELTIPTPRVWAVPSIPRQRISCSPKAKIASLWLLAVIGLYNNLDFFFLFIFIFIFILSLLFFKDPLGVRKGLLRLLRKLFWRFMRCYRWKEARSQILAAYFLSKCEAIYPYCNTYGNNSRAPSSPRSLIDPFLSAAS